MIRCVTVTASDVEPISLEEMKLWLKVDEDEIDDDPVIASLITSARKRWEERTNRSALQQTFDAYFDETPYGDAIKLPRAPLVSVTSVTGFSSTDLTDTGGTVLSSTGYYVDTASEPGRVVLIGSDAWPTGTRAANAMIVRFVAGESTSPNGVQDRVKSEIKQLVAHLYEHRGDDVEQSRILAEFDTVPSDLDLPEWG